MSKRGESWMPRDAGLSTLGLIFRFPLACAPGGSAPPLEDWWSRHNRLAELELEYGIENSKVDSIRKALRRTAGVLSGAGPASPFGAISQGLHRPPAIRRRGIRRADRRRRGQSLDLNVNSKIQE